jgi:hypothetical protein
MEIVAIFLKFFKEGLTSLFFCKAHILTTSNARGRKVGYPLGHTN